MIDYRQAQHSQSADRKKLAPLGLPAPKRVHVNQKQRRGEKENDRIYGPGLVEDLIQRPVQIYKLMAIRIRGCRIVRSTLSHPFCATAQPALSPIDSRDFKSENGKTRERQQE